LQTLNEQIDHNQPYYIHIQRIQSDLDRLANLMKTVLSFSKSSTYNMIEMDIVELIEKVLMRWQTHLAKQQIQTHFQTELTSAYILGHAQALEQVFTNLFSNALRAMEGMDDGTLHIKVDRIWLDKQQDYIQITVSDNGIGIPKEHLDHIFQPFFTTDHQNGTGLGLTITERIVIAHKGKIQVKSFPSGGSVFILTFPAVHPNKT
jgi:two-component system C4-dicarboxylate transport sensor histidine kinase DctB